MQKRSGNSGSNHQFGKCVGTKHDYFPFTTARAAAMEPVPVAELEAVAVDVSVDADADADVTPGGNCGIVLVSGIGETFDTFMLGGNCAVGAPLNGPLVPLG
jgi:hypothetical protein